jgi:Rho-type GTPase-activating protein 1/2
LSLREAAPETTQLTRSLTNRFDNIRTKYRSEIEPLFEQRETLLRELDELKIAKEESLEEATRSAAQNESLQELNVKMQHQHDTLQSMMKPRPPEKRSKGSGASGLSNPPSTSTLHSVTISGTSSTLLETQEEARYGKGAKSDTELNPAAALRKFGWFKGGGGKDSSLGPSRDIPQKELPLPPVPRLPPRAPSPPVVVEKPKAHAPAHNFQQQGILRAARCDHCTDKMWGTQLRCMSKWF